MKTDRYTLNEKGEPIPEPDLIAWATWIESAKRHVGDDNVGGFRISTVFLGLDHSFGKGPPVLWETMVFPGNEMDRCSGTREQAEAMHARMVQKIKDETTKLIQKNKNL